MAVAFDSVGPSSSGHHAATSPNTWTHTCVGSNVTIYAACTIGSVPDTGLSFTAATCDGNAMTLVSGPIHTNGVTDGFVSVYKITGQSSGAHTISFSSSGSFTDLMAGGSIGVTGETAMGTPVTEVGAGTTAQITGGTPTTSSNNLVVAFVADGGGSTSATSPATSRFIDNGDPNSGAGNAAGSTIPGTGSNVTTAWTITNDSWAVIAVESQAAGVPNVGPPFSPLPPGFISPAAFTNWSFLPPQTGLVIPPFTLLNNAEGGTDGTTVTTGNSGGASGTAWDLVNTGSAGTIVTFDPTHAWPPYGRGYEIATTGTATTAFLQWSTAVTNAVPGGVPQLFWRTYLFIPALPAANQRLMALYDTALNICGNWTLLTTGAVRQLDATNTQINTSSTLLPTGRWIRLEGSLNQTSATFELKIFLDPNSAVATETLTGNGNATQGLSLGAIKIGQSGGNIANYGPYWFDSIGLTSTGYLGPVNWLPIPLPHPHQAAPPQPGSRPFGSIDMRAGVFTATGVTSGPPVYPLGHPVRAQPWPAPQGGGRVDMRGGTFAQTGPPVRQWDGPVRAPVPAPVRGGTVTRRAGPVQPVGPPVRQWDGPVKAQPQFPVLTGRAEHRAGLYAGVGPAVRQWDGPVQASRPPLPARGRIASNKGTFTAATPPAGPPIYPLGHPVQARPWPAPRGGTADMRAGPLGQTGPPVRQWDGPFVAQRPLPPPGRIQRRSGTFTFVVIGAGPPIYPLGHPVQAKPYPPPRGGTTEHRAGIRAETGPPVRPPDGPVVARAPLPPRGRVQRSYGTYTFVVVGAGPPVYPLGHPVQARQPLASPGRVIRHAGTYGGTGPPVRQWDGPVAAKPPLPPPGRVTRRAGPFQGLGPPVRQWDGPFGVARQQPPPPTRGRIASLRGPAGTLGPPVRPLHHALRGQPQVPLLTGRTQHHRGVFTPPPDIVKAFGTATVTDPREGVSSYTDAREGTMKPAASPRAGTSSTADPREGTATVSDPREGRSGSS